MKNLVGLKRMFVLVVVVFVLLVLVATLWGGAASARSRWSFSGGSALPA